MDHTITFVVATAVLAAVVYLIATRKRGSGTGDSSVGGSRGRPGADKH